VAQHRLLAGYVSGKFFSRLKHGWGSMRIGYARRLGGSQVYDKHIGLATIE
jgi:hypothetical protein